MKCGVDKGYFNMDDVVAGANPALTCEWQVAQEWSTKISLLKFFPFHFNFF